MISPAFTLKNVQLLTSLATKPMPQFIVQWREVTRSSFKGIESCFKGITPPNKGLAPSLLGCMNHFGANNPRQNSFYKPLELTESELFKIKIVPFDFHRVRTLPFTYRVYKYADILNKRCAPTGKSERKCGTRALLIFNVFLSFSKFDMKS